MDPIVTTTMDELQLYASSLLHLQNQAEILHRNILAMSSNVSNEQPSTSSPTMDFYGSLPNIEASHDSDTSTMSVPEDTINITHQHIAAAQQHSYKSRISLSPSLSHCSDSHRRSTTARSTFPYKYHGNMARSFPIRKHRTPEEQLLRQRNTEAARLSRIRTKIMESQMDADIIRIQGENLNSKRKIAAQRVYANMLLEVLGNEPVDWDLKWMENKQKSEK
jgi:hypothetical protein